MWLEATFLHHAGDKLKSFRSQRDAACTSSFCAENEWDEVKGRWKTGCGRSLQSPASDEESRVQSKWCKQKERKECSGYFRKRLPIGVMECYFTWTYLSTTNNPKRWIRDANILKASRSWRNSKKAPSKTLRESGNPRKGGRNLEWQNHFFLKAFANPGTPGLGFGGFSVWYVPWVGPWFQAWWGILQDTLLILIRVSQLPISQQHCASELPPQHCLP